MVGADGRGKLRTLDLMGVTIVSSELSYFTIHMWKGMFGLPHEILFMFPL